METAMTKVVEHYTELVKVLMDNGYDISIYGAPWFIDILQEELPDVTCETHADHPDSIWVTVGDGSTDIDIFLYNDHMWCVDNKVVSSDELVQYINDELQSTTS